MLEDITSETYGDVTTGPTGQYLSAEDVGQMVALIKELREVTLSRKSFTAANAFLARFTSEDVVPELVRDELLAN